MSRRFSTDVPDRSPQMRRMEVRSYLGNGNYLVTMGDGTPQTARSIGSAPARGTSVMGRWNATAGVWMIEPDVAVGVTRTFVFVVAGLLAVGAVPIRLHSPSALTISSVLATVDDDPADGNIILDVNVNGTTIFTTQANRPTILDGTQDDLSSIPDITALALDDVLTIDIDEVGVDDAGADLVVQVRCVGA